MKKIYIPVVGDVLRLEERTSLSLINDGQNRSFVAAHGDAIVLPKNTSMIVDRVYVRKGCGSAYNSVTFVIPKNNTSGAPSGRFFLPVDTVNNLALLLIKSVKVEAPKNPTKKLYDECLKNAYDQDVHCNSRTQWIWSAFTERLLTQPSLMKGSIDVSLAKNVRNFQGLARKAYGAECGDDYLHSAMEKLILSDPDKYDKPTILSSIEGNNAELANLREQEHPTPMFRFDLKQFNGEAYLHLFLMDLEKGPLANAYAVMNNSKTLHRALYEMLNRERCGFVDVFSVLAPNAWDAIFYKFGQIEGGPHGVIVAPDKKEAILPFSAFSNNYLTATKLATKLKNGKLSFDLPLTFSLSGGETGDITGFRAAIRKIVSKNSPIN